MSNHLRRESSPYLLQHAENPVDWYPWCEEAFAKAAREEKPVFLSIGYSTCHWCHVMAHESFENPKIADILNRSFVSVKVDREERPDIDSVYMAVCQAFTGRGGWPMSIFMTAEQKPFFAGTYYPPDNRQGMIGFVELLETVRERWQSDRRSLCLTAEQICSALKQGEDPGQQRQLQKMKDGSRESAMCTDAAGDLGKDAVLSDLAGSAAEEFKRQFDPEWGGFGDAPKFPAAHNLLFLMLYHKLRGKEETDEDILGMVEKTLDAMRRGGIFDQIGYGFSRYSTDRSFFAPHFEKMLYDNALLMMAYAVAHHVTGKKIYLDTAEQVAQYLMEEMADDEGGFYSAQDADSEGEEGRYYLWGREEICSVLGEERGAEFCNYYGVTNQGDFSGKNILNLLNGNDLTDVFEEERRKLYLYRRKRGALHLDDKILTSWNAMTICGLAMLYRVSGNSIYLTEAENVYGFIEKYLAEGTQLYVGCRNQKKLVKGFLEEYAYYTAALLFLYDVTAEESYLSRAQQICREAQAQFADERGGYFLYGTQNSSLITKPRETYDGAMPSGNSVMAYCLVKLARLTGEGEYARQAESQLAWMAEEAEAYPSGHCLYLTALLLREMPEERITVVSGAGEDAGKIIKNLPILSDVKILERESAEYRCMNGKTTYYMCREHTCLPPDNCYYSCSIKIR